MQSWHALTPEDDEGTWELLLDPEIRSTLHDYALVSMEACFQLPTENWRALDFEGAVHTLLWHMSMYRLMPPQVELVRLSTIDKAEHGHLDFAIGAIHTALRRIEESREVVRKTRAQLAGMDSIR